MFGSLDKEGYLARGPDPQKKTQEGNLQLGQDEALLISLRCQSSTSFFKFNFYRGIVDLQCCVISCV